MTILCLGDSHASFFSGLGTKQNRYMQPVYGEEGKQQNIIPYFKSLRISGDATTAYQLMRRINVLEKIVNENYKEGDILLFCFGEIDCRLHMSKRILLNNEDVNSIVKECVDRYFKVILYFLDKKIKCAVWGVIGSNPPSLPYPNIYKVGTMEQRNKITILFNNLLKQKCDEYNIKFISIFDHMVVNLVTNPECIQDNIHLSQILMPITIELFKKENLI